MRLFEKIMQKFSKNERHLITPTKTIKECSNNVAVYRRELRDSIEVVAKAIDKDSKYIIELENDEAFNQIVLSYPRKMFEGYCADINYVKDSKTKKVYVVITFNDVKKIDAPGTPWVKVILAGEDEEIAMNLYNQLNEQALDMENAKNKMA